MRNKNLGGLKPRIHNSIFVVVCQLEVAMGCSGENASGDFLHETAHSFKNY